MERYTGKSSKVYYLEDTPLGRGGEGSVYAVRGEPDIVAKLYHKERLAPPNDRMELLAKIETMYSMNIKTEIDGILRVAWVKDILFDGKGLFVGFVMPRVLVPYKIFDVAREDRKTILPNYTWKYSLQYAYNLSWVVWYLHLNNIVIGDCNMNNIAIGKHGEVVLIDCDSFDIRDPDTGKHYPCTVGLDEMLAPELQTVGSLRNGNFTKESDDFSLAIHIFRLLMNNADPFGAKVTGTNVDSKTAITANAAIVNGECPYFRKIPGKAVPPHAMKKNILPPDIAAAFERTFNYTQTTAQKNVKNRTTAEEWNRILLQYAQAEPNPKLKTCRKHTDHVYSSHLKSCPFCAKARQMKAKKILSTVMGCF